MNLRNDMRQKNTQIKLDFHSALTGETRPATGGATELRPTIHATESPASAHQLMKEVCEGENLKQALQQVKANKGSPGIDGMTVDELPGYLQQHWPAIREQLLNGTYEPKPVRRVEIPKPDGGGMRKLGIPTVLDRYIQQAVRCCSDSGTRHFPITATGSDQDGRLIKQWPRRSSISPKAMAGALISIWKNFSIESITTN